MRDGLDELGVPVTVIVCVARACVRVCVYVCVCVDSTRVMQSVGGLCR